MAFLKYAAASVVHPAVSKTEWSNIRVAGKGVKVSSGAPEAGLIDRASEMFHKSFNPNDYLLSHVTIIASVDVIAPPGAKTGSFMVEGRKVNRRFADFRVTSGTQKYINNNKDAWSRGVLLKAYPTFVGGHNFVEHVQVEEMSKGRIIDAVARDIGDSVYVDILIATDRRHQELIQAIQDGKMSTLSMGCFLPGTQVTMADGCRISIEDVQPGDMVLTHKGRAREVLNKQIRGGKKSIRRIKAVGVPDTIEATDNHPFFVFRQPDVCACGCGGPLPEYKGGRKNATRGLNRRFLRGHDKRILNPNNTYSIEEYQERKSRMDAIQSDDGQWVRAENLRVGDFMCFPRAQGVGVPVSEGRARLLGYFLAEGSFCKYKGRLSAVEFSFSLAEKDTFAAEVVELLKQEFPGKDPTIQPRVNRNVCMVRLADSNAAEWFKSHGGEYSNGKRLSLDVLSWTRESHKHLIGAWINGDGCRGQQYSNQSTSAVTTSYDLACQMHMLMARCGWFARMECRVGARTVQLQEVVNSGFIRDEVSGRLPAFNLVIGKVAAQDLSPYTVKVTDNPGAQTSGVRVRDDMTLFPITSIEEATYEGWVHNMEVDEDNSYVVSGICSHNCTVDGTVCTKCGHWAADETEMCSCIKYAKGNTFYDEQGQSHIIAELCGHESMDPTGGVHFIEGSWVGTPAFTGAVLRSIVEPTTDELAKAAAILASTPPQWSGDQVMKAANFAFPQKKVVVGYGGDTFLAGWGDEVEDGEEEEDAGGEEKAPANPMDDTIKKLEDHLLGEVSRRVKDRMKSKDVDDALSGANPTDPNDSLIKEASIRKVYRAGLSALAKTASCDAALVNGVAELNKQAGVDIPVTVYRAALTVGRPEQYDKRGFVAACAKALGHDPSHGEAQTILRIGKLLSQRVLGEIPDRQSPRRTP